MSREERGRIYVNESFLAAMVILIAFSLRALHVIFTSKFNPLAGDLTLDALIYDKWAKALVWGGDAGSTQMMQAPLFPWFVSLVYRFFGPSLTAVRFAQAILGTAACGLVTVAARRLFRSSLAGILAGLTAALYLPSIFFEGVLVPATLILFLNALLVFVLVPESGPPSSARRVLAGLILGLSVAANPSGLLMVPFVLVHIALFRRGASRALLRNSAFFLAGFLAALAPLAVRNHRLSGEFTPLTSGGGINFYIGNNPEAQGFYNVPSYGGESLGGTPRKQLEQMTLVASRESGRELGPSGVSSFWLRKGIRYCVENPGQWFSLLRQKAVFFWNSYERANVENLYFHRTFGGILALPLLTFGIVAPLCLLGIFMSRERRANLWLLYGGIASCFFSALLFYVLARYRLPMMAFVFPFAGAALAGLLKLLRDRRRLELALMIAALLLIARLVNTTTARDTAVGMARNYARVGRVYHGRGEREKAAEAFREALRLDPSNTTAQKGMKILGGTGL
jgi:4-amino-4-deoxy-L-arabinose transferase-like glycosyltransferase